MKTNPLLLPVIWPFFPVGVTISSTELVPEPLPPKPDPMAVVIAPEGKIPDPERLSELLPLELKF